MIHVIATIEIAAEKRDAFLNIFYKNMLYVLAEEGCMGYAPTIDMDAGIPMQSAVRKDCVVVLEQWETLEHLHAHLTAPHMAAYKEKVKDIVTGVTLRVLESAG